MVRENNRNFVSGDQDNDPTLDMIDYMTVAVVIDLMAKRQGTDAVREIHELKEQARREGYEAGYRLGYYEGEKAASAARNTKTKVPRTLRRQ